MKRRVFQGKNGHEYTVYKDSRGILIFEADPDTYMDIVTLPATVDVSFGVIIYNQTIQTLYFTIVGSGAGWSWSAKKQLGSIASGANLKINVKSLGTRSKPASATDDAITLTFEAYSDAGYTILVGTYVINVTYHWINSAALTVLYNDDMETWPAGWTGWGYESVVQSTEFALSPTRSMRCRLDAMAGTYELYVYKTYNVPACTRAYMIANVKYRGTSGTLPTHRVWAFRLSKAGVVIANSGETPEIMVGGNTTTTNWFRMVGLVTPNQSASYRMEGKYQTTGGVIDTFYDDIMVVYEP